ncbi:unnamed protein product [Ectocarpus sp. CCAP 1310/34]|nr:unnamed protein product [Ectocarpus sp. CCAP 1310/34]
MGNKASVLFGTGPQNIMSDTEEGPSDETAMGGSKSTRPAAMTAEEQAEQTRYSELFGGKPKAKPKAKAGGGASEGRSARSTTALAKRQPVVTRQTKKQRSNNGTSAAGAAAAATESGGVTRAPEGEHDLYASGDEGRRAGGDSDPGSPYRGKAAWAVGTPAAAGGKGKGDKECAPTATKEERQKKLAAAISAKITYLEKGAGDGGGRGVPVGQEHGTREPVAAVAGGATDAARARAAVTNALFAGAEPTGRPSKELLVSVGGGGVLLDGNNHGAAGGASGAAAAVASGVTGRNTSPRPAPQRNYKLKI